MSCFCVQTRISTQGSHSPTALSSVMVSVWYLRATDSDMQPEEPIVQYYTSGKKGWKCLSSFLNNSCPEAGGLRSPVVLSLLVSLIHNYWIFHDASPCEITLWLPRIHILFWQSQVFTLSTQAMALLQMTQALTQVLIQIPLIPITHRHFSCNLNCESFILSTLLCVSVWSMACFNLHVRSWKIHMFSSIKLDLHLELFLCVCSSLVV